MTAVNEARLDPGQGSWPIPSRVARSLGRFARYSPLGTVCTLLVGLLLLVGIFGSYVAPHSYDETDIPARLQAPSLKYPFGTDNEGRDVFSRVIYGARTSVLISFGTIAIASALAVSVGAVSGYVGGKFDLLFQRLIDILQAFPGLIFLIFFISIFGRSQLVLILVLGVLFSAGSSRVLRSSTISLRQQAYVDAARSTGAGESRILIFHILPNLVPYVLVTASIQIGAAILIESSLSFLGYGVPPPFPSWGRMLQEAQSQMQDSPYLVLFPGAAISLTVYSFNMLGDALRDYLDPRMRGSR
jgi:peptide/nickel transport system permease protein